MTWTFTNLVIQIIAGILGGHAAAKGAKEHSFGALGHTVVGAVGGGLSGAFFQTFVGTMVTAGGSLTEPTVVEQSVLQGLTGAAAGGIVTLAVGFIKHGIEHHKSSE
jgi:hypothetical protein